MATGAVEIGGKSFLVEALNLELEIGLNAHLSKLTREAMGPAGFLAAIKEGIDFLKSAGLHAEALEVVREAGRMQASGATPAPAAVEAFRQTAKGAAVELFWRTRKTHPDVTLQQLEAIITEINALDVYRQTVEAVTGGGKAPTPSPSASG